MVVDFITGGESPLMVTKWATMMTMPVVMEMILNTSVAKFARVGAGIISFPGFFLWLWQRFAYLSLKLVEIMKKNLIIFVNDGPVMDTRRVAIMKSVGRQRYQV